jgi:hypothetical protein
MASGYWSVYVFPRARVFGMGEELLSSWKWRVQWVILVCLLAGGVLA